MQTSSSRHRRPSARVLRRRRRVVGGMLAGALAMAGYGLAALALPHPTGASGDGPLPVSGSPANLTLARGTRLAAHVVAIVEPGDTLWSLVRRVQPQGDIRPTVAALDRARHSRPLQVGESVELSGSH